MEDYMKEVAKSITLAQEYIERAQLVLRENILAEQKNQAAKRKIESGEDRYAYTYNEVSNVHTASLKRASMDLTRQLVFIRKPR